MPLKKLSDYHERTETYKYNEGTHAYKTQYFQHVSFGRELKNPQNLARLNFSIHAVLSLTVARPSKAARQFSHVGLTKVSFWTGFVINQPSPGGQYNLRFSCFTSPEQTYCCRGAFELPALGGKHLKQPLKLPIKSVSTVVKHVLNPHQHPAVGCHKDQDQAINKTILSTSAAANFASIRISYRFSVRSKTRG